MSKKQIRKEVENMQITIPEEIIHQFLEDKEEGMRQLITFFLNAVMEEEAKDSDRCFAIRENKHQESS